jgi:acyl carrier protein
VGDIGAVFRQILVRHLNADERYLAAEVRLVEDLGADSIALFEMVVACEEEFIEAKVNGPKSGSHYAETGASWAG